MTIRELRLAKEISQKDMAEKIGVHVNTYIRMESEPLNIRIGQAKKIADALEVSMDDIDFVTTKC